MQAIALTGAIGSLQTIGTAADRGCVRCQGQAMPKLPGDLVLDARGRYWHANCAAITLAEFTRFHEDRGPDFHYTRTFPET